MFMKNCTMIWTTFTACNFQVQKIIWLKKIFEIPKSHPISGRKISWRKNFPDPSTSSSQKTFVSKSFSSILKFLVNRYSWIFIDLIFRKKNFTTFTMSINSALMDLCFFEILSYFDFPKFIISYCFEVNLVKILFENCLSNSILLRRQRSFVRRAFLQK